MRVGQARVPVSLAVALLIGCADPGLRDTPDASPDARAPDASRPAPLLDPPDIPWLAGGVPPIAAPAPPAPVALTPCPGGWREVRGEPGAPATCAPYPAGGAQVCPPGQVHFPGEPACAPVGSECPSGEFADGLPGDGTVLFVRPGARGGDGTRAAPYGRISQAMARATGGMTVALAVGRYDEPVTLARGVALRGACARDTVLTAHSGRPVISSEAAGTAIRDLTLGSSTGLGLHVAGMGTTLDAAGVVISRATTAGVFLESGARLTAASLVVRDTRSSPDGRFGRGVDVEAGATAEIRRGLIERNHELGVVGSGPASAVVLMDVVIRDTQPMPADGSNGHGIVAASGARVEVTRALIDHNRTDGVGVSGAGTWLALTDVIVRDTQAQQSDAGSGRGLDLQSGATAEVTRVLIERNRALGVSVGGRGTTLAMADAIIQDTQARQSDGLRGRGLDVHLGATAGVTRADIERNLQFGVFVGGDGARLMLADAVIRGTQAQSSDASLGRGINVQDGASVELTRALVDHNRDLGVAVGGADATLAITDAVIRDTQAQQSDGASGRGLGVDSGATADLTRVVFRGNHELGAGASGAGSSLALADAVISDTQARESDGRAGDGVAAWGGARVEVTRALLEGNHDAGMVALDPGTRLVASDVAVRDTRLQQSTGTLGFGLALEQGAAADVTRALFDANHSAGVFADRAGTTLLLQDTVIRDTRGQRSDGRLGFGMQVQLGASVEATRMLVERSREVGVGVVGGGATLALTDVVIRDTLPADCGETTCVRSASGHGILSVARASARLHRFVVTRSQLCGALVADGGGLDLSDGELSENQFGVCLQVDGYDISRLTSGVLFRGNETRLETTSFPVPEPAAPVGM